MQTLVSTLKRPPRSLWTLSDEVEVSRHTPVMLEEVVSYLQLLPGKVIVDGTLGEGGHSEGIVRKITPGGHLIGIDQDDDALSMSRLRLSPYESAVTLVHDNFCNIRRIVDQAGYRQVDGILLDLGVSMLQFSSPERGFSFRLEAPLNMRMDKRAQITAFDLVNNLSQEELANLIYTFGEERFSRRIARVIVEQRRVQPIATTVQLAELVSAALPARERYRRIHPATRTFMALRIAVNRELEVLTSVLPEALDMLAPGGRLCVLSFHSLEDRIVKHVFRSAAKQGTVTLVAKKPLLPQESEIAYNPRSRSAKLRVVEKC